MLLFRSKLLVVQLSRGMVFDLFQPMVDCSDPLSMDEQLALRTKQPQLYLFSSSAVAVSVYDLLQLSAGPGSSRRASYFCNRCMSGNGVSSISGIHRS
jgi:hypothetical protein